MGNFWKYNDRVSTGAGVTGLDTADGGDAIADNEIIRGDGTTGIQGGVLTSADHNGDITGPTASTDTTVAGSDFANQPANDGVTVVSDNAGDTTQTVTIIGTTNGTDTVVVETIALNGVVAVNSVKVDWGIILAVKLSAACAGTVTVSETSGGLAITTIAAAATSKGVDTGSISCWNRIPYVVASGASTKQIGLKGTDSAGATIYDSQALTGATSLLMNSAFVTVTEYYVGDLESTRTATITAQGGVGINDDLLLASGADIRWSTDTGLARSAAGVVKVTDGGAGAGNLIVGDNLLKNDATASSSGIAVRNTADNGYRQVWAESFRFRGSSISMVAAGLLLQRNNTILGSTAAGHAGNDPTTWETGLYSPSAGVWHSIGSAGSTPAPIMQSREVEASTAGSGAPNVLAANESNKVLTNEGTTAENYHTLPSAAAGYVFTFVVQDADGLRVVAAGGDTIRVIDKVTAAAGYLSSTTIGSTVTLVAINGTEWIATSISGVWTDGTFTHDDTGLTSP